MKKERWVVSAKRADFQAIADRFGIDPVIARLIRNRDVTGEKEIEEYLFGDLEQLHDPLLMKDMERAADLIAEKIREKKPIRIIGDWYNCRKARFFYHSTDAERQSTDELLR